MSKSKPTPIPGIHYILKVYHSIFLMVLRARGQTHEEAAKYLGISLSTFQKILRLRLLPNFRTERGKVLAQRIKRWSGVDVEILFPEAFYTSGFLEARKTFEEIRPFELLLLEGQSEKLTLLLSDALPPANPIVTPKRGKKKRKPKKK